MLDELPVGAQRLGGGHDEWIVRLHDHHTGRWIGVDHYHRHPESGRWCGGCAMFDVPELAGRYAGTPLWHVEVFEPLTLSPSLLCRGCGRHGYIRAGAWEPV